MREEEVFLTALDLANPADRAAYLEKVCGGNVEFRRQVEELLAAHFRLGRGRLVGLLTGSAHRQPAHSSVPCR